MVPLPQASSWKSKSQITKRFIDKRFRFLTIQGHASTARCAPALLGEGLPLAYAQGMAEDVARRQGVARLMDVDAPRRQQPASEKQTALLRTLGLAVAAEVTKGEAADLLVAVLGDWD